MCIFSSLMLRSQWGHCSSTIRSNAQVNTTTTTIMSLSCARTTVSIVTNHETKGEHSAIFMYQSVLYGLIPDLWHPWLFIFVVLLIHVTASYVQSWQMLIIEFVWFKWIELGYLWRLRLEVKVSRNNICFSSSSILSHIDITSNWDDRHLLVSNTHSSRVR